MSELKRKKVGLFIENSDHYNMETIRGAFYACLELDQDLVVFTGSGTTKRGSFERLLNKNYAYELSDYMDMDRILVPVGSIMIGQNNMNKYLGHFKTPIITLNYDNDNYYSFSYASDGIKDIAKYLIAQKKCKKIAFIGGPINKHSTYTRLHSFKEALKEYNLEYDEEYTCHCSNYTSDNHNSIRPFLISHPEIDGIICVTDNLAYCCYDILNEMNVQIGKDILIASFDDEVTSAYQTPPLASVHADSAYLAFTAVYRSNNHYEKVNEFISTKFMPRESIGVSNDDRNYVHYFLFHSFLKHEPLDHIAQGLAIYLCDDKVIFNDQLYSHIVDLFHNLLLSHDQCDNNILRKIDELLPLVLTENSSTHIDIIKLNYIIDEIYQLKSQILKQKILRTHIHIYHQIIMRYHSIKCNLYNTLTSHLLNINIINRLSMLNNSTYKFQSMISECISLLNIKHIMILTFPSVVHFEQNKSIEPPDELNILLYIKDGKRQSLSTNHCQLEDVLDFFPSHYKSVSSLSFNNDNYGLLITDHPFTRLADIDYISSQLGASIFITNMLEHLNMTSITDELTSIYNRRGIQKQIRIVINNLKENEYAYVIFIDLDKLKEINDRYGHESGDCAIIMASKILLGAFPDDIVGRVGGDEFLVIIKPDHLKIIEHIDDRIEAATKALEKEYQYPFTVSLSYGVSILDYYTDEHTIKDIIDAADNFMYEHKRKRRSNS